MLIINIIVTYYFLCLPRKESIKEKSPLQMNLLNSTENLCESACWIPVCGVLLVTQSTSGFHEIASLSTFGQAKEDKN